ncbi:hypothetical protein BCR32DRAFT_284994 [Anaeromyces robustus]|uniref:Uncharacterized protein n=1 Tax=Anaeromyces robustus TaxID=1754192 RepID=A0A1Y1WQH8_9FUNG|nr:hypothetical protein BCR32DRAFT_284994 [Anaeromyces robustus]|eukprot:ORX75645.1 hypothetical protein BCR32DRAFT_284994 [Anaeromyces robustus]
MFKSCIIIYSFLLISVFSIPLQYPVLNSKLKCNDYTCDECDNFLDGLKDDIIACAQSYITDTNDNGFLSFTPGLQKINNDEYECASFKIKINSNGEYEDEETKILYDTNNLVMIIKDAINQTDCQCKFNYSISNE